MGGLFVSAVLHKFTSYQKVSQGFDYIRVPVHLIRFGLEITVIYTTRYAMRHNTTASLHNSQFDTITCSQSIVFLLVICRLIRYFIAAFSR